LYFDVTDYNKCVNSYCFGPAGINVGWHRCDACGFLFTAFYDDWSLEDFRRLIYNDDYIKVDPDYLGGRPNAVAAQLARLLQGYEGARILDYGGGTGLFAQRMRELGFGHTEAYDPYSLPDRPSGPFDIITCTEVIEHAPQPQALLADMQSFLSEESCILIGESLQPPDIDAVRCNWWYVAPRNGHVSIYADRTLATLAHHTGMVFHRGRGAAHAMRCGERFRPLAEKCGPPLAAFRLGAPGKLGAPGFSSLEGTPGTQFQWTCEREVGWQIAIPGTTPRTVQICLPYVHLSRADFAMECKIRLADKLAQLEIRAHTLFAEFADVAPGGAALVLSTPELRQSQDRNIGIALLVV
jgi:hypothetical protein